MGIRQFIKRESICDSRNVENISDKRLRIEVQPAQTNGLVRESVLWTSICIAMSVTWKGCANFDVAHPENISSDAHVYDGAVHTVTAKIFDNAFKNRSWTQRYVGAVHNRKTVSLRECLVE